MDPFACRRPRGRLGAWLEPRLGTCVTGLVLRLVLLSTAFACASIACTGSTAIAPPPADGGATVKRCTEPYVFPPGFTDLCASTTPFYERVAFRDDFDYLAVRTRDVLFERGVACATATDAPACKVLVAGAFPTVSSKAGAGVFVVITRGDDVRVVTDLTTVVRAGASLETDTFVHDGTLDCRAAGVWVGARKLRERGGTVEYFAFDVAKESGSYQRCFATGCSTRLLRRPDDGECALPLDP